MSFSTPFDSVLGTNFVPSLQESTAIERVLERPSAESQALATGLAHLHSQLASKRQAHAALAHLIEAHRNLLTPFRTLPDDILAEIFAHCLPTTHEALRSTAEAPLLLTTVCRRWRTVALTNPRLWASLHIAIPTAPQLCGRVEPERVRELREAFRENVGQHQEAVRVWLNRAKACELSISVYDPNATWPDDDDLLLMSYYALVCARDSPFPSRICRLAIDVNHQSASDYLASVPASTFPALRILLLKFHHCMNIQHLPQWTATGLLTAPRLACLSVLLFPLFAPNIHVNWGNLTHLVASGTGHYSPSMRDVLKIFTACPRLRLVDIKVADGVVGTEVCTPFSLPHLHTLALTSGTAQLGDLFQCADLPALRTVTYYSGLSPRQGACLPLLAILARTGGRMEALTTNIQYFTLDDMLEVFELTPRLRRLALRFMGVGYPPFPRRRRRYVRHIGLPVAPRLLAVLMQVLMPEVGVGTGGGAGGVGKRVYLPQLEELRFDLTSSQTCVTDRELLDFVRARLDCAFGDAPSLPTPAACRHCADPDAPTIAPLRRISISPLGAQTIDIAAELADDIAHAGLRLDLVYAVDRWGSGCSGQGGGTKTGSFYSNVQGWGVWGGSLVAVGAGDEDYL